MRSVLRSTSPSRLLALTSPIALLALSSLVSCVADGGSEPASAPSRATSTHERAVARPKSGPDAAWMANVQARIQDAGHIFRPGADGAFRAEVPERRLLGTFDASGARIGMQGRGTAVVHTALSGQVAPALGDCVAGMSEPSGACVRRVEYTDGGMTEWWESTAAGFEQGWIVEQGSGAGLTIPVQVDGADVIDGGDALWLQTADGVLAVRDLTAVDATGRDLEAHLVPAAGGFTVVVDDAGGSLPRGDRPGLHHRGVELLGRRWGHAARLRAE